MKALALIPSRYESKRFCGKPLAEIKGKPIVMWVYDAVKNSGLFSKVYVATDDERIEKVLQQYEAKYIMTSKELSCGTQRCEQALTILEQRGEKYDVVVNIQGDEPLIKTQQMAKVLEGFEDKDAEIVTLAKKIEDIEQVKDVNVVKVVKAQNKALYFSRSIVPFNRDEDLKSLVEKGVYFKHIGIYAYLPKVLHEITLLEKSTLEQTESLEQLRWLENGYHINVMESEFDSIGVDTPQDLEHIKQIIN
ncbi:MAG: 3-deoxy-manno-octulosonate cytidylyltransferase [Bacteroidales bacterium]|nr:3-deoxy-manno-octulosonate cytidylyltransferase [Bacteroidales bacterium]